MERMKPSVVQISKYRTEIMGICILWIMLFHSSIPVPENTMLRALWTIFVSFGGGFGVDIFFLLSGFGLMTSEIKATNDGRWGKWYRKRFVRIIPAYLIVALSFFIVKGDNAVGLFYDTAFLNFILDGDRQFWYIFAILFCYSIFPVVAKLSKLMKSWQAIGSLIAISIAVNTAIGNIDMVYYQKIEIFLTRIPCFLIGCYLAFLYRESKEKSYYALVAAGLLLGAPLFVGVVGFTDCSRYSFALLSLPVLCLACVVCLMFSKIFIGGDFVGIQMVRKKNPRAVSNSCIFRSFDNECSSGLFRPFFSRIFFNITYPVRVTFQNN